MPFSGWKYQPDYFAPPAAFHVGSNSSNLMEPLCLFFPFRPPQKPEEKRIEEKGRCIHEVVVYCPVENFSETLTTVNQANRLTVRHGREHLMEVTLGGYDAHRSSDFRPEIPLVIHW